MTMLLSFSAMTTWILRTPAVVALTGVMLLGCSGALRLLTVPAEASPAYDLTVWINAGVEPADPFL